MKQTAVEWLEEQLDILLELYPSQWEEVNKSIEQAKEMEKQQQGYSDEEVEFKKTQQPYSQETTLEEAEKEFEKLINGKGLPTKQLLEVAEHYFIVGYEIAKERNYSDAIDLFITEIKNEFKDDNWDYLEFIKVRVIEQFKKK